MYTLILFNSVDLTLLTDIYINNILLHSRPARAISISRLARADGAKLVNSQYGTKEIVLEGFISSTSRANYEVARDLLMKNLQAQEATLRFSQAGANRDYTATVENIIFNNTGGGFGTFSIKFVCSTPFGFDTSDTTALNASSNTAATSTKTFSAIGGSYKVEPTITVEVSAISGGTGKYIKLTNPATGKYIKVTRNWAVNDTFLVNCKTKTVTVEGVAVDYTGVFPTWDTADTQLQYDDDFTTSRTVLLTFTYKKTYL